MEIYLGVIGHEGILDVIHRLGVDQCFGFLNYLGNIFIHSIFFPLIGDVRLEEDNIEDWLLFLS
jgi:hypothetical protein